MVTLNDYLYSGDTMFKIIYNTAECEPRVKQSGKRAACDASGEKQQGDQDETTGGRALWSCDEHPKTLQCHPLDVGAAEREKIFSVRLQEWPAHKTDGAAVSGR